MSVGEQHQQMRERLWALFKAYSFCFFQLLFRQNKKVYQEVNIISNLIKVYRKGVMFMDDIEKEQPGEMVLQLQKN